ncbi:NUDIX hydrolase [Burkholderia glumae]|uniref:NUDIX hydrolase n=1 Tax=Burkholderia glumae TaxID=337 RepID=A0AAP9Y3C4_BURGL|nr:NUDIX hydrolase [Burkholderia glumae]ACR29327.1 NUDIX domain-containing protein [Burkholderia glumae BGR1]MCM2482945.1 NUDIX hydrolase [Burkholderia glumae]MCM2506261.1 NUDIX hydrolase [Burkholderia glumae]MCM2537847.1 NUDIX hydrolase [Burkholderia glumae]PNL01174.1 NUDIX hydrolase [Burkholderia glumae]
MAGRRPGRAARALSCGTVLLDPAGRLLLAHATETSHWDIPKGHIDPGESERDAALRELFEETGIALAPARLVDLGRFAYRSDKDLYLFAARLREDETDLSACLCTSMFPSRTTGASIPEMDAFRWVAIEEVARYASRGLTRLFSSALSLADLHRQLPG